MNEKLTRAILTQIGIKVKARAIRLCPIDQGQLRASIQFEVEGNEVKIFTDPSAGGYSDNRDIEMEYGKPPGVLDEKEKQQLKEWAKRHNLPAYPIIKKIETEGIKVGTPENPLSTHGTFRPYLRPALHQTIPEIPGIIKEVMK